MTTPKVLAIAEAREFASEGEDVMSYTWDLSVIVRFLPVLVQGAILTIQLTCIAVGMGILIGTFVGIGRVSKNKLLFSLSTIYVNFIRGTPMLVQLYLVYFGLPAYFGTIPPRMAAIITLSVNSGAYVAEIVRAGIQSIDRGQLEAARSLGMTYPQAMRYVLIPQTFKRIIPPWERIYCPSQRFFDCFRDCPGRVGAERFDDCGTHLPCFRNLDRRGLALLIHDASHHPTG